MTISRYYQSLACLILLALVGCAGLPFGQGNTFFEGTPTADSAQFPSVESTSEFNNLISPGLPGGLVNTTPPPEGQLIRIWLPPQFDPQGNSTSSVLLRARLEKFETENPGVRLEVRVKALDGPGGVLDALVAASAAAPAALPDLVLMPRPVLESAALKGLLYPYDGLTTIMDDQNWFDYAIQLSHLKDKTYGIPFAGNIMIMTYSSSRLNPPPAGLDELVSQGKPLLFPAGDAQALFTVCMYLAEGGKLQDDQGRPVLEEASLENILDDYHQASLTGAMPYTLTEYLDDAQVWETFLSGQFSMAVTWASIYLNDSRVDQANLLMAPLPTPDGTPFALAGGWSWVLAGQDSTSRLLSVKLAEYMVEKNFLAGWSRAAGYLPPRADALQSWPATASRRVVEKISYSAWLVPSADLVSIIGPALQTAVVDVLRADSDAHSATLTAISQINHP